MNKYTNKVTHGFLGVLQNSSHLEFCSWSQVLTKSHNNSNFFFAFFSTILPSRPTGTITSLTVTTTILQADLRIHFDGLTQWLLDDFWHRTLRNQLEMGWNSREKGLITAEGKACEGYCSLGTWMLKFTATTVWVDNTVLLSTRSWRFKKHLEIKTFVEHCCPVMLAVHTTACKDYLS